MTYLDDRARAVTAHTPEPEPLDSASFCFEFLPAGGAGRPPHSAARTCNFHPTSTRGIIIICFAPRLGALEVPDFCRPAWHQTSPSRSILRPKHSPGPTAVMRGCVARALPPEVGAIPLTTSSLSRATTWFPRTAMANTSPEPYSRGPGCYAPCLEASWN